MKVTNLYPPDHLSFLMANDEVTKIEETDSVVSYTDIYGGEYQTKEKPEKQDFERSRLIPGRNIEKYGKRGDKLGGGTYGNVYLCEKYADKVMKLISKDAQIKYVPLLELSILLRLNHPNVIEIIDVDISGREIHMLMPLAIGDLEKNLLENEQEKQVVLYQMIRGVAYCLSRGIIHRDIKPSNFLLFPDNIVKLADFGISRTLIYSIEGGLTQEVYTLPYRAPEIALGRDYDKSADIWALGVSMYYVYTGSTLFDHANVLVLLQDIFSKVGNPVVNCPDIIDCPQWIRFINTIFPGYMYKDPFSLPLPQIKDKEPIKWPRPLPEDFARVIRSLIQLNPFKREDLTKTLNSSYFDKVRPMIENNLPATSIETLSDETNLIKRSKIPRSSEPHEAIIVWIIKLADRLACTDRTFFLFLNLFDFYYHILSIEKKTVRLYAIACLYLAGILNEIRPYTTYDLSYTVEEKIVPHEILDTSKRIINAAKFDFLYTTSYDYLTIDENSKNRDMNKLSLALLYSATFTDLRFKYSGKNLSALCKFMAKYFYDISLKGKLDERLNYGFNVILESLKTNRFARSIFEKKIFIRVDIFLEVLTS